MDKHLRIDTLSKHVVDELTVGQAWSIYLSHFLSMWISRMYEYGTILFIQHIFPGDLLPSSINGIAETVCVLVSSTTLGQWIDQSPTRLRPLLLSIITNRATVVVCCLIWLLTFSATSERLQQVMFVILLLLGMVEKASRMSNTLSMERDWIPTVASHHVPSKESGEVSYSLTHLNTVVRRIDIVCKFLAPLTVSGMMALIQPWIVASFIAIVGILSSVIEVWSALRVWRSNSRLREPKPNNLQIPSRSQQSVTIARRIFNILSTSYELFWAQVDGFEYYFRSDVWIPSLGIAIFHASVLVWSGTLITWCLNANFSYTQITIAKGIGSVVEISSTFVFPLAVRFFERRNCEATSSGGTYQMVRSGADDENDDPAEAEEATQAQPHCRHGSSAEDIGSTLKGLSAVIMTAKYSVIGLTITILPALAALFSLDNAISPHTNPKASSPLTSTQNKDPFSTAPIPVICFLTFMSLSFLGRWTYDLAVTQLTQVAIPASRRSGFGGTEMALVSVVSLVHWVAATVWHQQADFKWLATGSVLGVGVATASYLLWAARWSSRRGG